MAGPGTLRKLKSGNWQGRYVDPSTGKQVPLDRTFRLKAEAQDALNQVHAKMYTSQWTDLQRGKVTLREWSELWLASKSIRRKTYESYESHLRVHILPTLGHLKLSAITPEHVRRWYADLLATGKSHVPSKAYGTLNSCLRAAVDDGRIAKTPCVIKGASTPPQSSRVRGMTVDEIRIVREGLPERYRAWLSVAAFGGPRWSECVALTVRDVDFDRGRVNIDKTRVQIKGGEWVTEPTKTRHGVRSVALPPTVMAELKAHIEKYTDGTPDDLVFTDKSGKSPQRGNFRSRVWLPAVKPLTWSPTVHDLRHTAASLAIHSGANAKTLQNMLGHARASMTLDTYSKWIDSGADDVAHRMEQFAAAV